MGGFTIALIIFVGLVISLVASRTNNGGRLNFILSYLLVFILAGFVTYTPDWDGYELWVQLDLGRDVLFNFFRDHVVSMGYGYQAIHLVFTGTYSFFLIYFLSRFTNRTYPIVLLYIPLIYLYYTTQVRFFLGYYSMCLAFYFYYIEKRKFLFLLFAAFAILSHTATVLFLPLIYFFTIDINKILKRVIQGIIVTTGAYWLLFGAIVLLQQNIKALNYLTSSTHESSILGGLFTFLPSLLSFFLIQRYANNRIKKMPHLRNERAFSLLYRLSLAPYVFIGIAVQVQIIGQRFILPAVLFQILLLFYLSKYNTKLQNFSLFKFSTLYFAFYLLYIYVLPGILLGTENSLRVFQMLKSNIILNYFF